MGSSRPLHCLWGVPHPTQMAKSLSPEKETRWGIQEAEGEG